MYYQLLPNQTIQWADFVTRQLLAADLPIDLAGIDWVPSELRYDPVILELALRHGSAGSSKGLVVYGPDFSVFTHLLQVAAQPSFAELTKLPMTVEEIETIDGFRDQKIDELRDELREELRVERKPELVDHWTSLGGSLPGEGEALQPIEDDALLRVVAGRYRSEGA